jgi:hypothetical protein
LPAQAEAHATYKKAIALRVPLLDCRNETTELDGILPTKIQDLIAFATTQTEFCRHLGVDQHPSNRL